MDRSRKESSSTDRLTHTYLLHVAFIFIDGQTYLHVADIDGQAEKVSHL